MKTLSLEETVRSLLTEQQTIAEIHDPSSPNKGHLEEDDVNETSIGENRRGKKKTSFAYTSLGGRKLSGRAGAQRQGNQKGTNRYEDFSLYAEEATKKVIKKISEKNNEKALGKTATGQQGDTIDIEPTKTDLTGSMR